VRAPLLALAGADGGEGDSETGPGLLALIKTSASIVRLASMLTEISRLEAVRAIGLPAGVFADVAPRVLAGWRAWAAMESPSHLRDHGEGSAVALLTALVYCRTWEIIDALVTLLLRVVHAIGAGRPAGDQEPVAEYKSSGSTYRRTVQAATRTARCSTR
jgi:hypothetical protein